MGLKDDILENDTIKWGINTFVKIAFILGITGSVLFFLEKAFGFTFNITASLGL